jgi:Ala-tRNA(Pro) deacylase
MRMTLEGIIMIDPILKQCLQQHHTPFEVLEHQNKYTSLETTEAAHVSGKQVVKSLILWVDYCKVMVLLPANYHLDFELL